MAAKAAALSKTIRDYLSLKGWFCWRNGAAAVHTEKRFYKIGTPGLPDIMASRNGEHLAIEVKYGKDQISDVQTMVLTRLAKEGWRVIVARSLDDVMKEVP